MYYTAYVYIYIYIYIFDMFLVLVIFLYSYFYIHIFIFICSCYVMYICIQNGYWSCNVMNCYVMNCYVLYCVVLYFCSCFCFCFLFSVFGLRFCCNVILFITWQKTTVDKTCCFLFVVVVIFRKKGTKEGKENCDQCKNTTIYNKPVNASVIKEWNNHRLKHSQVETIKGWNNQ